MTFKPGDRVCSRDTVYMISDPEIDFSDGLVVPSHYAIGITVRWRRRSGHGVLLMFSDELKLSPLALVTEQDDEVQGR